GAVAVATRPATIARALPAAGQVPMAAACPSGRPRYRAGPLQPNGPAMTFRSSYRHGFARIAACTLEARLADPAANGRAILDLARQAHGRGVAVAVFPELALSAYSIDDLLLQDV